MEDYKAKLDQVKVSIGEYFAVLRELQGQTMQQCEDAKKAGDEEKVKVAAGIAQGLETALEYADELLPSE